MGLTRTLVGGSLLAWAALCCVPLAAQASLASRSALPDAPGFIAFSNSTPQDTGKEDSAAQANQTTSALLPERPCVVLQPATEAEAARVVRPLRVPCPKARSPYQRILDTPPAPLTTRGKAILAAHNFIDPFNLLTVAGNSAVFIGMNSHTAYGPGFQGFGRNVGYSLVQTATGEFVGTFAACSLFHQDPRYQRMPHARLHMRALHAISHTLIATGDDGKPMPNYENFVSYPVTAELANLYVPGVPVNAPSTAQRILLGLASDPIGNLIAEFVPDLAKRIHIRVVFVQQILNHYIGEAANTAPSD